MAGLLLVFSSLQGWRSGAALYCQMALYVCTSLWRCAFVHFSKSREAIPSTCLKRDARETPSEEGRPFRIPISALIPSHFSFYLFKTALSASSRAFWIRSKKEVMADRARYVVCKLESNPGLVRWMRWQWSLMTTSIDRLSQPHLLVDVSNTSWRVLHLNQAAGNLEGRALHLPNVLSHGNPKRKNIHSNKKNRGKKERGKGGCRRRGP